MSDEAAEQRPVAPPVASIESARPDAGPATPEAVVTAETAFASAASSEPAPSFPDVSFSEGSSDVPSPHVPPAMVDRGLQAQLGQQLRALFDHVAAEPVPDRLLKLLEQLEEKEKRR